MATAEGVINCGACGFKIQVKASSEDRKNVKLEITSTCPSFQKIGAELTEVDAYEEIFHKLHEGQVYQTFAKYSRHPSCSGLSGILKTIEVAAGLALPKTASIEITKD